MEEGGNENAVNTAKVEIKKKKKSHKNNDICCACGAARGKSSKRRYHLLPKDPEMKKRWIMAIGKPSLMEKELDQLSAYLRVCSHHFTPEDYCSSMMCLLKPTACPSKFESEELLKSCKLPKLDISKFKEKIQKSMQEYEEHSYCFVPGCKSGYTSEGNRACSLFYPPLDEDLFEKWKQAIPRTKKGLTRDKLVCELHFHEEDIERFYITKLDNGYIDITQKEKPTLKSGAIPSIFDNMSVDLPKDMLEENYLPEVQNHIIHTSDSDCVIVSDSVNNSFIEDAPAIEEYFSYKTLLSNLSWVKKPNHWWSISPCVKFIICARWNSQYIPEKRVIIECDLTVRVFLWEMEVNISGLMELTSINDISALLGKVENYKIRTISDLIS